MKGIIICHEIHHAVIDVLFWEGQQRHGSNGQYTLSFADNDDRAGERSCLKKGVGVFCRLTHTQKEKNNMLTIHSLYRTVKYENSYMHNFLTSRMWSIASLACLNFLGGTTGDGNMSGKAFSMASDCFTVKNKNSLIVFLQPVISQQLTLGIVHYQSVFTFVQQWRPHDLFENSIKLSLRIKVPPPGLHFRYEVRVPSIEDPLEFIHKLTHRETKHSEYILQSKL